MAVVRRHCYQAVGSWCLENSSARSSADKYECPPQVAVQRVEIREAHVCIDVSHVTYALFHLFGTIHVWGVVLLYLFVEFTTIVELTRSSSKVYVSVPSADFSILFRVPRSIWLWHCIQVPVATARYSRSQLAARLSDPVCIW